MANEYYYNQKPGPDPVYDNDRPGPSSSSYYATPAISSDSRQHLAPGDRPPQGASSSPFDTVFDDNAYPASTHSSMQRLSQQDTGYRGPSTASPDDIPLQSRQRLSPKDAEMQDHVYDAPQPKRSQRGGVRFGELGMLGSGRKKIPFVVYFFTLVQVAVFVGEIVKNGE